MTPRPARRPGLSGRVYGLLLVGYPREFRRRHGAAMVELFLEKRDDVRANATAGGRARFWLATLSDVARNAAAERAAQRQRARAAAPPRTRGSAFGSLAQDVRFAVRRLRHEPGFTVVALLTLAIGIGANTAMFSAVHGVLLRPLGFPQPDRLVELWQADLSRSSRPNPVPGGLVLDWQAGSRAFSGLAAYAYTTANLTGQGEPARIPVAMVSTGFFSTLGVRPAVGRDFRPADAAPGAAPVVIVSHDFWRRHLAARGAGLDDRTVDLNGRRCSVIGVMPAGLEDLSWRGADLWMPVALDPTDHARGGLRVVARLGPGVSAAQARADLEAVQARVGAELPDDSFVLPNVLITPLRDDMVRGATTPLVMFQVAALLVLLIMCANLGAVLLARASARQTEMAIRAALGAGRRRLARQLLTESLVLSLAGAVPGLLVARWGVGFILANLPADAPRVAEIGLDPVVLWASFGLAALVGLVFGLVPAIRVWRTDLDDALRRGSPGGGGTRSRALSAFVVGEVALALVLLVGAGLMSRSLVARQRVEPGFDTGGALAVEVSLPRSRYPDAAADRRFFDALEERLQAVPGVQAVGLVNTLPLSQSWGSIRYAVPDAPDARVQALFYEVSAGYFGAMRIPVRTGRAFTTRDDAGAPAVAIVSEQVARRHWPGGAVGHRVRIPWEEGWRTIVGVVGDVQHTGLDGEPDAGIYVPARQMPFPRGVVVLRGDVPATRLVEAARSAVQALDPGLPLFNVRSLDDLRAEALQPATLFAELMGAFSLVALALGAVGLYGVVAYAVSRRTREMGLRLALGARRGHVLRLFMGAGLRLVLAGLALGWLATLGLAPLVRSLLYGVAPTDPLTMAGVTGLLLAVAAAAAYLPARRATAADPVQALRAE
jgi:putative ABC transport system permease protein